jgi:D-alanyl-D-alanine dipeptidase
LICAIAQGQPQANYDQKIREMGLVDVQTLNGEIMVDLRYASTDNFMKQNIYGSLRKAYFLPHFARKVARAQEILQQRHPEYHLLIYDAARPRSAQRRMRQAVEGTPYTAYVADASRGGRHNYGVAVDLTIADKDGRPLDMGAPFDHFGRTAWIGDGKNTSLQHFKEYIAQMQRQGLISAEAAANRTLLVEVMDAVGLRPYAKEWWHYQERVSMTRTRELYKLLDF